MATVHVLHDRWLSKDLEVLARALSASRDLARMWLQNALFLGALIFPRKPALHGPPRRALPGRGAAHG